MGMRSRLARWIAKDEATRVLISDELKQGFQGFLKDEVKQVLMDEEINTAIVGLVDAHYDRIQKKFWGQIGGIQKGLNNLPNKDTNNLVDTIISGIDNEDGLNLATLIKLFLAQGKTRSQMTNIMNMGEMT